jgi:hypothetical protein
MYYSLMLILIICFAGLVILNLFFRLKVFAVYKRLIHNRVDFNIMQIFNQEMLETNIISNHPKHKEDLLLFAKYLRTSVNIGVLLLLIIVISGLIMFLLR